MSLTLASPFPKEKVSWRAQTVTKSEPYKGLALAYIDARDVMERLDEVVGSENWQDSYAETASGRVICTLSVKVGGEWVSKSDGAGSTDIEGDKGGISDAFKRAAVKWGVGRYLYDLPAPWVPCEVYNGRFSKFTDDPWNHVKSSAPVIKKSKFNNSSLRNTFQKNSLDSIESCGTAAQLKNLVEASMKQWLDIANSGNGHDHMAAQEILKQYILKRQELGLDAPESVLKPIRDAGYDADEWVIIKDGREG